MSICLINYGDKQRDETERKGKKIDRYIRNYAITDLQNFGIAGFRSIQIVGVIIKRK